MEEETIAILTSPEEYAYHIGEVASVGTHHLRVIRRKFSIQTPYQIEHVPMAHISRAEYKQGLAPFRIGAGGVPIALLCAIFHYIGVYWDSLQPGTKVPVGMLGLAGLYGLRWAFMSRLHALTFHLHSGGKIRWKSRSGDFKYKDRAVGPVFQHLRRTGLLA